MFALLDISQQQELMQYVLAQAQGGNPDIFPHSISTHTPAISSDARLTEIQAEGLYFCLENRIVYVRETEVILTVKEFDIFALLIISLDGKTVRSTCKMESYDSPLHIISAQISELGITFASKSVQGKSNEIPAVQQLIGELDIQECMVVADALNCQRETAETIVRGKGDYLLDAKGNQPVLEREIREYVQDESLRKTMDRKSVTEKSRDRIERRTAYTTTDVGWLLGKEKWKNLCCIGAIKTEFERKGTKTEEWHYYISSRDRPGVKSCVSEIRQSQEEVR